MVLGSEKQRDDNHRDMYILELRRRQRLDRWGWSRPLGWPRPSKWPPVKKALPNFFIVPKYLAFLRSNSGQEKPEKKSLQIM